MMISPNCYYKFELEGKTKEEILRRIRDLQREIRSTKRKVEGPGGEAEFRICPDPLVRISCCREYLETAIRAYEEAGGVYRPSRAELKDKAFNESLGQMKRFVFEYGGSPDGTVRHVFAVEGEQVLCVGEPFDGEPYTKDYLVGRIAELHIGEWKRTYADPSDPDGTPWRVVIEYEGDRRPVRIVGRGAFPYNFRELYDYWLK